MDSPSTAPDPGGERPLERLLTLLGRDQEGVRLCTAANTPGSFRVIPSMYRPEHVDAAIAAFTQQNLHVYFEINYAPHIGGGRTTEKDVTRLSALWADIDFKAPPKGMGDEYMARELVNLLSGALGVEPAAIVRSGHGLQPYWPISDGTITDINQVDVINLSKRWGLLVQELARAEGGGVDSVFDLARVFRAPGSVNWKDEAAPIPVTIEYPAGSVPLTLAEVSEVLDAHGIRHPDTAELSGEVVSPPSEWQFADADCGHLDIIMDGLAGVPGGRHQWLLQQATILTAAIRYGCITRDTFRQYRTALEDRLKQLLADPEQPRPYNPHEVESAFRRALLNVQTMSEQKLADEMRRHPHSVLRLVADAEHAAARGQRDIRIVNQVTPGTGAPSSLSGGTPPSAPLFPVAAIQGATVTQLDPITRKVLKHFSYTDAANAERLADHIGDEYIYVSGIGWHVWRDGRYLPDEQNSIMEASKASLLEFRDTWPTVDLVQAHVAKSLSLAGIRNAVTLAASLPGIVIPPHRLDADPYLLHTPTGTVNLTTGLIRETSPRIDLNTKAATVSPDYDTPPERWLAFLTWCMGGKLEMVDYLQQMFGATLIGEPRFHILPICTGRGRNGKSTMLQVVEQILGPYAKRMPEGFLIEKQGQEHPTEIAALRGVRLAIAQEARANGRFAEARVKQLTGEKVLTGRFMGENWFDFKNSITLWLGVNHLPTVAAGGDGFWRRIRRIEFPNKIAEALENPDLDKELVEAEGGAILAWMIEGARRVIKDGLRDPDGVRAATHEYAVQEDHLGQWVADNLMVAPGIGAKKDDVYTRYADYSARMKLPVMAKSVFLRELPHYITIDEHTSTTSIFGGIALAIPTAQAGPFSAAPNVQLTKGPLPPSFGSPFTPPAGFSALELSQGHERDEDDDD